MNPLLRIVYEGAGMIARLAGEIAPPGDSKVLQSLRGRRGIQSRYAAWGRARRDPARPLLWIHAPSVGEGLQARPVIEILRARRPEIQIGYTFFSPSAEGFARSLDVDFHDYLPFDTTADAHAALDALRARAIVFSKLDVWPVLVHEASQRGVRLGLMSATLAPGSARQGLAGAALLRDAYALLDAVGAVDDRTAERLEQLGARSSVISITGDTRYDQVWARAHGTGGVVTPLLARIATNRPTVVAGSTWPADEKHLLDAWRALRATFPAARLLIAPHEPSESHLQPIERWASAAGISIARIGAEGAATSDIILVDRTGVLGDAYGLATFSFVGGAFHRAGVHSVLEPAAFGVPVLFGPHYQSSRDAAALITSGGGLSVSSASEMITHFARWLADDVQRRAAGERARALVQGGLGAAERSASLVERLLN